MSQASMSILEEFLINKPSKLDKNVRKLVKVSAFNPWLTSHQVINESSFVIKVSVDARKITCRNNLNGYMAAKKVVANNKKKTRCMMKTVDKRTSVTG